MKLHPSEMFFYYDADCPKCRKAKAYAHSITPYINEYQFQKIQLTSTQWRELLDMLHLRPKDLLNRSHPDYQAKIAGHTYDDEGWLNILVKFPYLLKGPIAVKNHKAILCKTPKDIYKLA
ncbi:MAG: arsenate reductase family protein [Candidatus Cyclobacteriaceae bacterium M3_2C_046]